MKAVRLSRFGGPGSLDIIETPKPRPETGEVLIRVKAAGVNFFETLMLRDRYAVTPELPMVPGVEIAGEVEATGEGVASPIIGARVAVPLFAAGRASGGYAEYLTIEAGSVVPVPDDLAFEDAVALMVQGLTAVHLVRQSRPQGKAVLVHAAAGGVGSLLVQLTRAAGAIRVIAAAGSPERLQRALALRAQAGVDYTQEDWTDRVREANDGRGVDIIYETVGGGVTRASLAALATGGEMMFAALGRVTLASEDLERMFAENQSIKGFALLPLLSEANVKADLSDLFLRAAAGALTILHGGSHSLDAASKAHRALENRETIGKLVLHP